MAKLLIASRNKAKIAEYRQFLEPLGATILSLADLAIVENAAEDADSFVANALQKAHFFHTLSGLPTLGDDGGIAIDFLNGEPGVRSRRWPGYEATDRELIDLTVEKMKNAPVDQRQCHFVVALAFVADGREEVITEQVSGVIQLPPSNNITAGYPYRSVFFLPEFGKYFSEITEEEHRQVNHRRRATERLLPLIKSTIG